MFPDGKTYAFAFGVFFGLMELIPFVGPFLGALPPMLVALFQDPVTALWVGIFFVALQQIEGHIVAPHIFGHTLRINPLLVIFALLAGRRGVRDPRRAAGAADRRDRCARRSSTCAATWCWSRGATDRAARSPAAASGSPCPSACAAGRRRVLPRMRRAASGDGSTVRGDAAAAPRCARRHQALRRRASRCAT